MTDWIINCNSCSINYQIETIGDITPAKCRKCSSSNITATEVSGV